MTKDPRYELFRFQVRELLEGRGWSGRELERQTKRVDAQGINTSTLSSQVLNEERPAKPTKRVMEVVAKTLGVSPDRFPEYRAEVLRQELQPETEPSGWLDRLREVEAGLERAPEQPDEDEVSYWQRLRALRHGLLTETADADARTGHTRSGQFALNAALDALDAAIAAEESYYGLDEAA